MEDSLKQQIKIKGEQIRELKSQNADQNLIATEVAALQELKKQLTNITGESKSKSNKFTLKTPKVTYPYFFLTRENFFSE
jgi:hypothetical protein